MFVPISKRICDTILANPGITAKDVAEKSGLKPTSVKVILTRMTKKNVVIRSKTPKSEKAGRGPQNLYTYSMPDVKSDNANSQN